MGKLKGINGATPKKITDKELGQLHEHIGALNHIVSQVGQIETRKFYAMQAHQEGEAKLRSLRKELNDKYGNVNIDTKTGEISKVKEDGNQKN